MVTYKIHLIRHAMTAGNRDGRYVGRMDIPVCQEGREEVLKLQENYEYPYVQEVYTSPLLRCLQTADMIYPDTPRTIVEDLVELSMGEFEGKFMKDLQNTPEFISWISNSLHNSPPGAVETGEEFASRIANALNSIFINMSQNKITEAAIITHGGVLMSLLSAFALPRQEMASWAIGNAMGYTIKMSTALWMRDNVVEVWGTVPIGKEVGGDPKVKDGLGVSI